MEDANGFKMVLKKQNFAAMLLLWILGLPLGQALAEAQENSEAKVDYAATQQEIQKFAASVSNIINSAFSSSLLPVTQQPKGGYVPDFGIALQFTVNIYRAVNNTPFGEIRAQGEITLELKMRRIEEVKEKLIRALQDSGNMFPQLRKEDSVAIIAHFEDRNFPDEPSANKTIVMSALKKDLDEFGHKNDRFKEFKQRIKIVEY
jgi:hypothetical protein